MDTLDASNGQKRKRKVEAREHTAEEKRKQRKEWKKRKREAKRQAKSGQSRRSGDNDNVSKPHVRDNQETVSVSQKVPVTYRSRNPEKQVPAKVDCHSRSALMVRLAQEKSEVNNNPKKRPQMAHLDEGNIPQGQAQQPLLVPSRPRNFEATKKELVLKETRKSVLKELDPEHIEYLPQLSVGSGSYGQCYRARYRGIEVVVKKMIHKDTKEDKLRAKSNLIHEAEVITTLGDHEKLPMIIGVITTQEPFCLVTQFHGVSCKSITLHQAANTNMISPSECIEIVVEICSALNHVHSRGFLHNDIKANNLVIERKPESDKYTPILIDFGKGTKASVNLPPCAKRQRTDQHNRSYLAPEVSKYRQYSTASDVDSLGRTLKAVSKIMGFYHKVRFAVKNATRENPHDRSRLDQLVNELAGVHFK